MDDHLCRNTEAFRGQQYTEVTQIAMPRVGFEPMASVFELAKSYLGLGQAPNMIS
jgi:hypothetical protein